MAKRGPRNLAKKTIGQLKATLQEVFNKYIRLNKSVNGYGECFTCNKIVQVGTQDCQAGHFIPCTYSPTRFEEDNVNIQCSSCNISEGGKPVEYRKQMIAWYGEERVVELETMSTAVYKWDRAWLIEKIEYYRECNKEMK